MKTLATMGGAFEFTRIAASNLREKDDSWNPAIGGFFGGAVAGMRCWQLRGLYEQRLMTEQFEHFPPSWVSELDWQ